MYLWLELFLISTGITARLIIPASTCGSGVNLLVVIFIWLALLVHLLDKSKLSAPAPSLPTFLKLLLVLFGAFIIISFINAPYKFGAFQYLVAWLSDIVLFYLVYALCARDPKNIVTLLSVFLATALMVILYGLYQRVWELRGLAEQVHQNPSLLDTIPAELQGATIARAVAGEPFATFIYQNSFGAFLALIIPILIITIFVRRNTNSTNPANHTNMPFWKYFICMVIVLLSLYVLVKTGSKGSIVALILGIGLASGIYYFLKAPSVKRGVLLAGGVIIGLILFGFIIRSQMSGSLNIRLGYWDATVKIIRDNPLTGVGLNQFSNSYLYYKTADAGEVLKAHNDYLQMASELGIPALLVFLAIWFIILKSIGRPTRALVLESQIPYPASRILYPVILGAGFAFCLSEIFQTPLIALDIPFLSTIFIFILWVMVFRFLCGWLSKCHCEESWTTKQSQDSGIATPCGFAERGHCGVRNDNKMMGLLRIGLFAGLLAFLIHCTVDFNFYVPGLSMSVWFIGAIFLSTAEPSTSL
ncbi:MAG TPA: O-antigen ligase family protein, partial [Planctomycetota bacterium]|nr:O-antigen ligase family protein [Planctomycetota bacterium]